MNIELFLYILKKSISWEIDVNEVNVLFVQLEVIFHSDFHMEKKKQNTFLLNSKI